jgi:hypothetical protein
MDAQASKAKEGCPIRITSRSRILTVSLRMKLMKVDTLASKEAVLTRLRSDKERI